MLTDIEIARACRMKNITEIAAGLGLSSELVEPYGRYKAKIDYKRIEKNAHRGRLVLVTAINPTPAGEGKTTVSIGLADALRLKGESVALALREPSLGPVFGMKGGAAGGGHAQVVPMEDINLHFTGDIHAITSANNLIAALVDNSIHQGNKLNIDPRTVTWRRCMDMNDRQMRYIVSGLGGKANGSPREEGFDISTASEVMATFTLAEDLHDLKERLSRLIVARTFEGKLVHLSDLNGVGAVTALLVEALKPNLVQTLEGTPAFVHGGPFANIAHGCNSVIATKTALSLADIVVSEAGFGADLGAEKFIDIKCRKACLSPSAVVLVASVKALKSHGGAKKEELAIPSIEALGRGMCNLERHIHNIREVWHLPVLVAVNHFATDSADEIQYITSWCEAKGVECALQDSWANGGKGSLELADKVISTLKKGNAEPLSYTYPDDIPLRKKIELVARKIYGAKGVTYAPGVLSALRKAEEEGYGSWPVCIAKTQYSFSDDKNRIGAPVDFSINIRSVKVSAGAGFIVAIAGDIMTMPGLPKVPAAEGIEVSDDGVISGLF